MQLTHRHLTPTELDHELIWLSVSVASLGSAAAWFALGLPWPHCVFHDLTGHPCLTCGATRAAIQFLHGHFLAALRWNPLVFAALCALSVFNPYALVVLITRAPRLRIVHITNTQKRFGRAVVIALLALNWIYLLAHGRDFS
jgi:hypothetical protein